MYQITIYAAAETKKEYTVIDREFAFDIIETALKAIDLNSISMIDAITGEVLLILTHKDILTDEMRQIKSVLD